MESPDYSLHTCEGSRRQTIEGDDGASAGLKPATFSCEGYLSIFRMWAFHLHNEARGKGAFGSALKGVELKARLNRLFDKDEPEMMGYMKLIQSLTVNINQENITEEIINITPEITNGKKK